MRQISESIHRKPRGKKCSISARFTNWVFPHMYNLQGIPSGLGPEREIRNGNGTGHTRAGMTHANQICKRKQKHTGDMHVNPCGLLCYLEVHFTSIKQNWITKFWADASMWPSLDAGNWDEGFREIIKCGKTGHQVANSSAARCRRRLSWCQSWTWPRTPSSATCLGPILSCKHRGNEGTEMSHFFGLSAPPWVSPCYLVIYGHRQVWSTQVHVVTYGQVWSLQVHLVTCGQLWSHVVRWGHMWSLQVHLVTQSPSGHMWSVVVTNSSSGHMRSGEVPRSIWPRVVTQCPSGHMWLGVVDVYGFPTTRKTGELYEISTSEIQFFRAQKPCFRGFFYKMLITRIL